MSGEHHHMKEFAAELLAGGAAAYGAKKLVDSHEAKKDAKEGNTGETHHMKEFAAEIAAGGAAAYGAKKLVDSHEAKKDAEKTQKESEAAGYGALGTSGDNASEQDQEDDGSNKHSKIKMAAGIGAGILAAGGLAYGAKKLYDNHEEKKEAAEKETLLAQQTTVTSTTTTASVINVQGGSGPGVTYGSRIGLKHNMSGRFLDNTQYSPTSQYSKQSLAVCGEWSITTSTTWTVEGGNGTVQYGGAVKLKNAATGRYLHSHSGVVAPVTGSNQEVTCYDGDDPNNVWVVEPWGDEGTSGNWAWQSGVKLRHNTTGVRLYSREAQVQGGGVEVSGFNGDFDENLRWRAQQA